MWRVAVPNMAVLLLGAMTLVATAQPYGPKPCVHGKPPGWLSDAPLRERTLALGQPRRPRHRRPLRQWRARGSEATCAQGTTYRGTGGEICGGEHNWGATDVEVWYPR